MIKNMSMKPTNLIRHPEGGQFREVFRSKDKVTTGTGEMRSALTHIYFSLNQGEVSRFHRVSSDEVWNLYQGEGLRLYLWDGIAQPEYVTLSAQSECFCHVVSAGVWQAAEPLEGRVLAGCSVAPGFEYHDFELIDAISESAEKLLSYDDKWSRFL
jgi:predicted cupin superfamily sugar epimerase